MKHPLREILAHFAKNAEHTHEQAVQATYDMGHAQGVADAKENQDAAEAAKPVPQRRSGDSDDEQDAAPGQSSEEGKDAKAGEASKTAKT